MSKKTDDTVQLIGLIIGSCVVFMIAFDILDHYLEVICVIIFFTVFYYFVKYYSKKYGLDILPDYFFKNQKEIDAANELEGLRDVSNSLDVNFVYLMYDPSLELHKIGYSKDAKYREKTLQGQRPTIELISKKEYPSKTKARQIESLLHKKYASKRTRGEWFKLEKEDIDYVKGYLK